MRQTADQKGPHVPPRRRPHRTRQRSLGSRTRRGTLRRRPSAHSRRHWRRNQVAARLHRTYRTRPSSSRLLISTVTGGQSLEPEMLGTETHVISFLYLDELLLRVLVRVRVGVIFPCKLSKEALETNERAENTETHREVSLLDVGCGSIFLDTQHLVRVLRCWARGRGMEGSLSR